MCCLVSIGERVCRHLSRWSAVMTRPVSRVAARHWQQHPCCRFLIFLHPSDQSLLTSEHITTDHGYHGHQHHVSPHSGLWRFILNLKCKFYIFGHYVTCHIYLEFCKTDISSFHLKILISISPVNLNIIKPVIEKNNNGTVVEQNDNDIDESHEKMNLVDAFEEDYYDGEDREDRQLFFQRFRPRPLRLNPAAAALIPAIPTFVGGLHLIKNYDSNEESWPKTWSLTGHYHGVCFMVQNQK